MASAYLQNTTTTATDTKKFTWSFWFKRSKILNGASAQRFINIHQDANNKVNSEFGTDDRFYYFDKRGGSTVFNIETLQNFRDPSAWYHMVIAVDTTQSTQSDRVKVYVNGTLADLNTLTAPALNAETGTQVVTATNQRRIGTTDTASTFYDGLVSHMHFTDGYTYQASTFGETDSTSGIWKPKTSPSVTYGTNGFFLKMENSSDMGEDSSGNNNDFTTSGTITQTEDTPSNNFCTWNAINPFGGSLTNGNLTVGNNSSFNHNAQGTLGITSGKWYWEYKMGNTHGEFGICENSKSPQSNPQSNFPFYFLYGNGSENYSYNNATSAVSGTLVSGSQFSTNDILGVAFDADNGKLYFHLNGTYYNSGNPASGTGELISGIQIQFGGVFVPFLGFGTSSARTNFHANFGNGYFGTTAVSSSNSDGAGLGLFEYSVPSGYYALCTKNIKNYG